MLAKPLLLTAFLAVRVFAQSASCEKLASLSLPDTTITLAQTVATGEFKPAAGSAAPFQSLPAFCRVAATLAPSKDSDIKIEVWLPASGWNGKFEAIGNGGWSGAVNPGALANAVRRGYAAAATDTGHSGGSASFALGHPEKLVDFGYRAVHEMTVKAKAIMAAYYGAGPKFSYWNGCSSGGKQGLKEAQRFPSDYDGIIAGAPANYWTHLMAGDLWPAHATLKDPASYIPPAKYPLIHRAMLESCDALDGVKDGLIEDPRQCKFDPNILLCKGEDASACLTAPQVDAVRKLYAGARNPRTGEEVFPGLAPGSELGWGALAGGPEPFGIPADHFKYVVFKDPNWNFKTLNFDTDVALADRIDGGLLNATDPNLKDFFARGGKLLQYHGWSDELITPFNSINYYRTVEKNLGADHLGDNYRLFMVPGMAHCGGGEGPNGFDTVSTIEQWVEQGKAPDRIIAAHLTNNAADRTRPLCPYPQVAQYKGTGSTDEAASFVCKAPQSDIEKK
jgi:feruloyl esterase